MSPTEAITHCIRTDARITRDGIKEYQKAHPSGSGVLRDGFKEGWNPGMGEYVKGRRHYKELLKKKGLTEAGKESVDFSKKTKSDNYFGDDTIKECVDRGAKISGNEAAALKKGKYEWTT